MTQEQLKKLAEMCGYTKDLTRCYRQNENGDILDMLNYKPHKDANQFEQVLFAVFEELEIQIHYLSPNEYNQFNIFAQVYVKHSDITHPIHTDEITYKAEVLKAILKAVEE